MIQIKSKTTVTVDISVTDFANVWWDQLNCHDQALFFNILGAKTLMPTQLSAICSSENLNPEGRQLLQKFGEYAE